MQNIVDDRRFLVPSVRLELVVCQDHKMNILFRNACMTSVIGIRKNETEMILQDLFKVAKSQVKIVLNTYLKKSSLQNN